MKPTNSLYSKTILPILILCLAFTNCQKDLNFESEVVLLKKELIIQYEMKGSGDHIIALFESEEDLLSGVNSLQIRRREVIDNVSFQTFAFDDIEVEEVFVKLRIVNSTGTVDRTFKYEKSIKFPDYNLILIRRIITAEWTAI